MRIAAREMRKMMNVKVGGTEEEKKCCLPRQEKKNMAAVTRASFRDTITTGNSSTVISTRIFPTPGSSAPTAPAGNEGVIDKSKKMNFSPSLSQSSSPPPQVNYIETNSGALAVIDCIRRKVTCRGLLNTTAPSDNMSASSNSVVSSNCLRSVSKSWALLTPILIPLLLLSVTMQGLAVSTQPNLSSSPSMFPLYEASSSPSTDSLFSSSIQVTKSLENHRHHPVSASSLSHLTNFPQADDPGHGASGETRQTCYVCLPPDKNSRDAEDILSIFPRETGQHIPDCASFGSQNANKFEFKCPAEYVGCLLRIHGKNESRSCGKLPLNDCKTANSVELCYCTGPLCNGARPELSVDDTESDEQRARRLEDEKEERDTTKIWRNGETDDEDLLGRSSHPDIDGMQDDTGDFGSGNNELPPGVIEQYTTTPKPTLIPNLRPDSRTTTPKSTSGASATTGAGLVFYVFNIPFTISTFSTIATLVPILFQVSSLLLRCVSQ